MAGKVMTYKKDLPHLKVIIQWSGNIPESPTDVISWEDAMKIGTTNSDDQPVLERHLNMAINECCLLIYTSGTTGNPKGIRFLKNI